ILTIIEAPYWFGEMELFDEGPRSHDARAEGAATVIQIPQEAIKSILEREPRYWRDMGLLTALKTRVAFKAIEDSKAGSSLT
uniref:cyclic nucleotide-binding domain-containing protein n=1 Tax=Serratia marcescens TaxID=615 RepID=UPI0013DB4614